MRNVDWEKFLADYDIVLKEKENMLIEKDNAIILAKEETEKIWKESFSQYPERIKDNLIKDVVETKENEYNVYLNEIDTRISFFEKYVIVVEDEVIEEEQNQEIVVEPETFVGPLASGFVNEPKFDSFGNLIQQ